MRTPALALCILFSLASPGAAAELTGVEPSLVLAADPSGAGGTLVTVRGRDFSRTDGVRIGGKALLAQRFVDVTRIEGRVPNLPSGFYDVDLVSARGGVLATLPRAVEVAPPVDLRSVTPRTVSREGGTLVTVRGANFRAQTEIRFGSHLLVEAPGFDRTETAIVGLAPPLDPGEPDGPYDVIAEDSRGRVVLEDGVVYETSEELELEAVEPRLVSTEGGTPVTFLGTGFRPGAVLRLGGREVTDVVFADSTRMSGRSPPLAEGFHDAEIVAGDFAPVTRRLPRAVEAAPPPAVRSVSPGEVAVTGGDRMTIRGENFRRETVFRIGGSPLVSPVLGPDGSFVTGTAPPHARGTVDVTAEDSRGRSVLPRAVTYVGRRTGLPAPRLTETALAYGRARFEWENTAEYDEIEVLDASDNVIARVPGDATRFETDTGGARSLELKFRGIRADAGRSSAVPGRATVHQCEVPPPLIGLAEPGTLEFTLYGGHSPSNDTPCDGGGGGGGLEFVYPQNGLGHLQDPAGKGYVVQESAVLDFPELFKLLDSNKLTTGFVLDEPADKLEISVYVKKLHPAAGLELRGRLIHVHPDDGFADEFSFPEMTIKPDKEWLHAVYFRSFVDAEGARQPCTDGQGNLLQIPAGEYLLDLYAVGGDPKLPYFQVADDPLDIELLIKGSPCPPYPAVRVTDLTGFRSVPQISCVKPEIATYPGDLFALTVNLHAQGTWIDFDNQVYRIHPDTALCLPEGPLVTLPLKNSPDFEYFWKIFGKDEAEPAVKTSGNSPTLYSLVLPDWGCYKVELTVRDKRCGLESKFSQELAIFPAGVNCNASTVASSTCPGQTMKSGYLFPTPDTGSIYGVIGLDPPPGNGVFQGKRPVEVRVLVVPCHCGTAAQDIATCVSASLHDPDDPSDDDIEFRLALKDGSTYIPLAGAPIRVTDPCAEVVYGPKYVTVTIEDLGKIPYQPALGQFEFKPVYLQARNRKVIAQNGVTELPGDGPGCWRNVGSPLRLANRPDALATSIWTGFFDEGDHSYRFVVKSAEQTERPFSLGPSQEIPLDVPGVDAAVPGHGSNDVSTGFTSRFTALKGQWFQEMGTGGMSGNVLGNDLKGEPVEVEGEAKFLGGWGGGEGGGAAALPYYEWCKKQTVFKNKFSTTLFEAIIYTGTIGPIPVTVWGSIGLGLDFLIEAYAFVEVAPFAPLEGGNFVELYFDLSSNVKISIPCEVRADILAGIASVAMRLRPEAAFTLIPYFQLKFPQNAQPVIDYFLQAVFSLYVEIEACIQTLIFGEQCFSPGEITLIDHADIIDPHGVKPTRPGSCGGGGGEIARLGAPGGEGAGQFTAAAYKVAVAPFTIVSPDRETVVDAWVEESEGTLLQLRVNEAPVKAATAPWTSFYLIDPAGAFVSNDAAIIAWTSPAQEFVPVPPIDDPGYLDAVNQNASTAEIHVATLLNIGTPAQPFWKLFDAVTDEARLLDTGGDMSSWRADGRPSVAGDLSDGEALIAWVRYDTPDFMILDGMTTTSVRCPDGESCFCGGRPCALKQVVVPNYRPQIELTAIFVRRVGFRVEGTPVDPEAVVEHRSVAFQISPPGINIQPSIATSPSGAKSWCVWLHDPTHTNLIEENRGRQILYSVYTKNPGDPDDPGQWSPPQGALLAPDDYPALLEPRIFLKGDDEGLLVFTALASDAPLRDTGLGGNRYVYASRLEGGGFGEPFRVHGKCRKRQYGYEQSVSFDIPDLIDPLHKLKWKNPEWVMVFQELGPFGTREGSGNVLVSFLDAGSNEWSVPVNLTPDDNIHTNVAATVGPEGLHVVHLDGGPAAFVPGAGAGGGGLSEGKTFVVADYPLEPDPAVTGCRVDFPYASPGSIVEVTVEIENRGLTGTPVDADTGESRLEVELLLVGEDGPPLPAARAVVPELAPGASTRVVLSVEVPLDPVRLRAEVIPGPRDRDLTNNRFECSFGTPAPASLACEPILIGVFSDDGRPLEKKAAKLSWSNAAAYDEILVYRDDALVASLPGGSTMWIDTAVDSGRHAYALRGRILVSKSRRARCTLDFEAPAEVFRRGDFDANGELEITDAIGLLGFLFVGSRAPECFDAADADDSGVLELTDAIVILGYLFRGSAAPPAPGPDRCGVDPTADALPACTAECR